MVSAAIAGLISNFVKRESGRETSRRWRRRPRGCCSTLRGGVRARPRCAPFAVPCATKSRASSCTTSSCEARPRRSGNYDAAGPLCNVFQIVELRDQIMAGPSAPLARSPSATRMPAPFLSHRRARASLLLPTSNTLSPNTDMF